MSPTVGTALGVIPPAPAHTNQGLGGEGEKTTPCLKGLGLDPRLSATKGGSGSPRAVITLPQQAPARQGALSQRAGCELSSDSASEASPLLSWWCKTRGDPS